MEKPTGKTPFGFPSDLGNRKTDFHIPSAPTTASKFD